MFIVRFLQVNRHEPQKLSVTQTKEAKRVFLIFFSLLSSGSSSGFDKELFQLFHPSFFSGERQVEKGVIRAMRRFIYAALGPIKSSSLQTIATQPDGNEYRAVGFVNFQNAKHVKCRLHWESHEEMPFHRLKEGGSTLLSSAIGEAAEMKGESGIRRITTSMSSLRASSICSSYDPSSPISSSIGRGGFLCFHVYSFEIIVPDHLYTTPNSEKDFSKCSEGHSTWNTCDFFSTGGETSLSPGTLLHGVSYGAPPREGLSVTDFLDLDDFLEIGEEFLRSLFTPSKGHDIMMLLSPDLQTEYQGDQERKLFYLEKKIQRGIREVGGLKNGELDFALVESKLWRGETGMSSEHPPHHSSSGTTSRNAMDLSTVGGHTKGGEGKKKRMIFSSVLETQGEGFGKRTTASEMKRTPGRSEVDSSKRRLDEESDLCGFTQLYLVNGRYGEMEVEIWFTFVKLCCRVFRFEVRGLGEPHGEEWLGGYREPTFFYPLGMKIFR